MSEKPNKIAFLFRLAINDHAVPFLVVASDSFLAEDNDSTVKMILETFEYDSISEVPKVVARVDIVKFDWNKKEVITDEKQDM